jgi:hypothetical protein
MGSQQRTPTSMTKVLTKSTVRDQADDLEYWASVTSTDR